MTRFGKKHLIVAANVAALAITVSIAVNSRQAVAQNKGGPQVTIDPTQLPLPVTGTVGVSGTQNVKVTNPATDPVMVRDVDNDARHPFQTTLCKAAETTPAATCGNTPSSLMVSSNNRLVIEYVSGFCDQTGTGFLQLNVSTTVGNTNAS